MRTRIVLGFFLAGLLSFSSFAGDNKKIIESKDSFAHTTALLEKISWHKTLDSALAEAGQSGKLVFWLQIKGQLDGMT